MTKAAVMMMQGFEESETVQIIDLLRRAGMTVDSFRFQEDPFVLSMQGMYIKADKIFSEEVKEYDVIVVPGGRESWTRFIANEEFINTLKWFNENNKKIAAMCSGTKVIKHADVIEGKKVTGYTGYESILTGAQFIHEAAVYDQNLITSQGPATPYPFAFKIMEAFDIDPSPLKERLKYALAGGR